MPQSRTAEERLAVIETQQHNLQRSIDIVTEKLDAVIDDHGKRITDNEKSIGKIYALGGVLGVLWPQLYNFITGNKQ